MDPTNALHKTQCNRKNIQLNPITFLIVINYLHLVKVKNDMKGLGKRPLFFFSITILVIIAICITAFFSSICAQDQIAKGSNLVWEKTFGGTGDDRAFYATTTNNGYLIVGSSTSFIQGKTVACIVRLDSDGKQVWNHTYIENLGAEFRYAQSITDGFLLVGNTFLSSGGTNGYIMKIDNQGIPIWSIVVNPYKSTNEGINKLFSAIICENTIVAVGLATPIGDNATSDVWIIKIDNAGNVLWSKTYGGASNEAARSIALAQDNKFIIAGYTDQIITNDYDFLILKIDSSGNMFWNQTFGGAQSDKAYAITSASDGCIIAGDTRSKGSGDSDAWIIKIGINGEMLWDQTVGGSDFDSPTCIITATDGSYLVAGTTFSYGNGQRDFWLFKITDLGKVDWSSTVGRSNYEEAYSVISAGNDDYIMAGWTKSLGEGHYDFYFIKLNVKVN
jgi:hypothetical protein